MKTRNLHATDYEYLIGVVDDWWGGRDMSKILPRQYFDNFCDTSFVSQQSELIVGFIVGYHCPAQPQIAYTHFVGVHPEYRKQGIATNLYKVFAEAMSTKGARELVGITADVNRLSQAVHRRMGFSFKPGNDIVDGIPIHRDYDGKGRHRVVFSKMIADFQ